MKWLPQDRGTGRVPDVTTSGSEEADESDSHHGREFKGTARTSVTPNGGLVREVSPPKRPKHSGYRLRLKDL